MRSTGFTWGRISMDKLKYAMKRYAEFPKYSTIPTLLNVLSLLLPVFIINRIYSDQETGYFDLTRQILLVPMALIASSLSQVLFQRISEKKNNGQTMAGEIHLITLVLFILSFAGAFILWIWGTPLFVLFFGPQWRISGEIVKVVMIGFAFKFIVATLSVVLIGLEKIKWLSVWQILYFIAILSLAFAPRMPFYRFCILYAAIESVSYIIQYLMIIYVLRNYESALRIKNRTLHDRISPNW
jgi:O-antigen/teichoic acid export membrane protein